EWRRTGRRRGVLTERPMEGEEVRATWVDRGIVKRAAGIVRRNDAGELVVRGDDGCEIPVPRDANVDWDRSRNQGSPALLILLANSAWDVCRHGLALSACPSFPKFRPTGPREEFASSITIDEDGPSAVRDVRESAAKTMTRLGLPARDQRFGPYRGVPPSL